MVLTRVVNRSRMVLLLNVVVSRILIGRLLCAIRTGMSVVGRLAKPQTRARGAVVRELVVRLLRAPCRIGFGFICRRIDKVVRLIPSGVSLLTPIGGAVMAVARRMLNLGLNRLLKC